MKTIFSKSRVETFSDGIFVIIITLLVLEIKVPHMEDPACTGALTASLKTIPGIHQLDHQFFTEAVI
ncbi:MAG: TMEM175 family protein [Bacteroidota bacterium]